MANAPHNLVLRYVRRIAGTAGGGDVADADLLNRFLTQHDEAAFELLLWRHGTMVWHVCRDVTRDLHAAEDAFQATFLALVRKAKAIRSRESLGAWLYQVAYRAALKVQRGCRETTGIDLTSAPAELPDESALHELRPLIHDEVQRLPAKYRAPVILCYLEGLTHDEAARQLGWPKGTVAGRVARAREMLRKRLTRRGIALSAALAALTLTPASASALVPATLVQSALRAGMLFAAGQSTAGVVSAHVLALSEGVLRVMFWNKIKLTAAVVFALSLVGSGIGLYAGSRSTGSPNELVSAGQDDDDDAPKAARKSIRVDDDDAPKAPNRKSAQRDNKISGGDAKAVAKARRQSINNLKLIALAMHNRQDTYRSFPASAIYGKNGKPLLSWRVELLPFLEQDNLYKQFHLDEPWDSEHNKKLLDKMPDIFHVPGQKDKTGTFYQVFVGEGTMFEQVKDGAKGGAGTGRGAGGAGGSAPAGGGSSTGSPGGSKSDGGFVGSTPTAAGGTGGGGATTQRGGVPSRGLRISDMVDGLSNTIMVIEGGSTVPWTKPEDLPYVPLGKLPALGGAFKDCIHAALGDGSVHSFKKDFDETIMRAAITRNGGEVVDMDKLFDPAPGADAKTLKQENEEMRRQVDKAHEEVVELTKMLRVVTLKDESKKVNINDIGEEAQIAALKREHQLLQQELDKLQSEIEQLKRAINERAPGERRAPTKKK
jgi:RNA polymerase sigma factor (sigma-70 family)